MRLVLLVLAVAVLLLLLPQLLRRLFSPVVRRPSSAAPDELVKDPVCHTYIAKSRALTRRSSHGPRYFCSAECASRFADE